MHVQHASQFCFNISHISHTIYINYVYSRLYHQFVQVVTV